ncbi:MAG TPA: cyanophycin synthetase, partial [Acidimicrobiia bacterium]
GPAGIARVKGELLDALDPSGLAVLVADDPATPALRARTGARVLLVSGANAGAEADADVRAREIRLDAVLRPTFVLESAWGSGAVHLAVRGLHQVVNASLAAAVALAAGVSFDDVVSSLATVQPAAGRMEVVQAPDGLVVLDDTYNANPASTAAAVRALASVGEVHHRIAVIGDMRELGPMSNAEHAAIGQLVAEARVDVLVTVGHETPPMAATARAGGVAVIETADAAEACKVVPALVSAGDAVLVKGSRAIGLEAVAAALLADRRAEGDAP